MIEVHIDISPLEHLFHTLEDVIEHESIGEVGATYKRQTLLNTSAGQDATGNFFAPYRPATMRDRERGGFQTGVKDLRRGKGRLYDLEMDGNTLTVKDTDHARDIALGQMTGVNGRWDYQHRFFGTSNLTESMASEELADFVTEKIR